MMRQYELVERVKSYNPNADEALLNRAYVYAMKAHGTQKRASGDPYFAHPLEVAAILTDLKLDDPTIVAAVLHDTIEDTSATREEIASLFGPQIAALVEGLTKIKKLDFVSTQAKQGENFRKLLLAIAEDVRVLLIKLADRLHNMRTLQYVSPEKRMRIAEETLDIYAPLAGRMGIQEIRTELERLSFKVLMPQAHATITARLEDLIARSGGVIARVENDLRERLAPYGIDAIVEGRNKEAYSIWRKMERKAVAFEQLSDIFGFRVLVATPEDCYRALGIVHTTWPMVPGRFKDYISTPKQNDYRSLHTTVVGPGQQRVELQIRTHQMHALAEYGVAAHTLYKDDAASTRRPDDESRAYQWLQRTVALLAEGDNPEEFLEHTKLELFHDQVFCFTPKGRLIALPRGATPIDFAYAVHTALGNGAVGAKVNGKAAPLISELSNGDEVEIVRADGQVPPAAWESLVVTGKARAAIRRATRVAVREQYHGLGRHLVEAAYARVGKIFSAEKLKVVLPRLARGSMEDMFTAVGRGEMASDDVVRAVYPDLAIAPVSVRDATVGPGWFGLKGAGSLKFQVPPSAPLGNEAKAATGPAEDTQDRQDAAMHASAMATDAVPALPIRGFDADSPVRFAPTGGALPGDRIVGILTPGEGITVYPIHSSALAAFENEPERWLDVRWDIDPAARRRFPAQMRLETINEPGTLAQIAAIVAEHGGNIDNLSMQRRSPDFTDMTIDLEVYDLKHLTAILSQLRARPSVNRAERIIG